MSRDAPPTRHIGHLVRRWWGAVRARAPHPEAEVWAERWLLDGERSLWRRLSDGDRAHALAVAHRYHGLRPHAARAEMAAALLHDCGKLDAGLGTTLRVLATLVGPRTERLRRYADHEAIGAQLLGQAGSDPVTVALVADSSSAPPDCRAALRAADDL